MKDYEDHEEYEDPLGPAKGMINGVILGIVFFAWIALIVWAIWG